VALDNIRLDGYPLKSQPEDPAFTVFPNPSQAEIFLRFNDPFPGPLQYRIFNVLGQETERNELTGFRIDIHSLPPGLYILRLYSTGKPVGRPFKVRKW
jgi:hypothetical protein